MPGALRIAFDTVQQRVKRKRLSLTISGLDWDGPVWSETWIDPQTNTLMLRPAPLRPDWHQSNTGLNVRWSMSDFGLSSSDGWQTHGTKDGVGAVRLFNAGGMASSAVLTGDLAANRAVFFSFFCFNVGNGDAAVYFECGWSSEGNGTVGVSLRFWSGGKIEVWKDNVHLADYKLGTKAGAQVANQYQDVLAIPMRGRELLVYSITSGDAFVHVFDDIAEGETNPIVTSESPWWFYVPTTDPAKPVTVDVECAAVQFPSSGYATSIQAAFGRPPETGASLESWENPAPFESITNGRLLADAFPQGGDVTALSIVELDGATAFVSNGTRIDCRFKVTLTGGTHTPFVRAAHMAYAAVLASTVEPEDGPPDVMGYLRSADLDVPDGGPAEITLTFGYPEAIEAELIPKFRAISNRPVQALQGDIVVIDGVSMPVDFVDGEHDGVKTATVKVRDRLESLRQAQLKERMPLDGLPLCKAAGTGGSFGSAVEFLYRTIGLDESELDLDDVDHVLPNVPGEKASELCHECTVGAHPYDELEQLQQDLASTFLWGARPTAAGVRYLFKDPDGFSAEPDITLYRSDEDAIAASADPDEAVYFTFKKNPLAIEANEVVATGRDPRTGRTIQSYRIDATSQDPTVPPADRPENWLGEPREFGIVNKRLSRQEDCDRAVEYIFPQVTALYWTAEWSCSMLQLEDGAPVWRGDLVELDGEGSYRVSSLRVKYVREDPEDGGLVFREATYTGGTLTNAGGVGLEAIKAAHARRSVSKSVKRPGSELLEFATTRSVVAV